MVYGFIECIAVITVRRFATVTLFVTVARGAYTVHCVKWLNVG